MPFIVYDQRLYLLNAGQNRLGSGADVDVQLPESANDGHIGIQTTCFIINRNHDRRQFCHDFSLCNEL